VFTVSVSLDLDEADELLRREWQRVLADDEPAYIDDEVIKTEIEQLLRDDRYGVMTFKYMFVSNVLAKAVHPSVHYRAIQTESELKEAFSSRTIAEQVLVDWEQENGQRLGGSNEPGTSKPFRWPEVSREIQVMRDDALELLYNLLKRLEEKTSSGELDPVDVLRYTLFEISQLESQTIDYASPSAVPYADIERSLYEYLEVSGGGERLAAVAAGIVQTYYFHAGDETWEVIAEHVNIPDAQSNAAGDIEVFRDGELVRAYEVKDKPVAKNDVKHAVEKAQTHELGEYLYLVGDGFEIGEERAAKREAIEAPIEMILVYPDELVSGLKFVGKAGRRQFVDYVGEFLNDMRAAETNKQAWKEIAEGFDT
jgi:hypothetical protein